MSTASGSRLQEIDNKLPNPLKLRTIRLTLRVCSLSLTWGFSPWIVVDLGKKIFADYQTMKIGSDEETKLIDLRWRLVWASDSFYLAWEDHVINETLELLLGRIHKLAAESASADKYSLREFGALLQTRLKEEQIKEAQSDQTVLLLPFQVVVVVGGTVTVT